MNFKNTLGAMAVALLIASPLVYSGNADAKGGESRKSEHGYYGGHHYRPRHGHHRRHHRGHHHGHGYGHYYYYPYHEDYYYYPRHYYYDDDGFGIGLYWPGLSIYYRD